MATATTKSPVRQRVRVATGIATALLACGVVLTYFGQFGVGTSFLGEPSKATVDDWLAWFWIYIGIGVALAVAAVLALSVRAWVTLAFAVVFGIGCVVLALDAYPNVRDVVNPAPTATVNPNSCQCSSGGTCDCPGG